MRVGPAATGLASCGRNGPTSRRTQPNPDEGQRPWRTPSSWRGSKRRPGRQEILGGALSRERGQATSVERVEALGCLAEPFVRLENVDRAHELIRETDATDLSAADREAAVSALGQAHDLRTSLAGSSGRGPR